MLSTIVFVLLCASASLVAAGPVTVDVCASAVCPADTICQAAPKQCLVAPCPQYDCVPVVIPVICPMVMCLDPECPNGVLRRPVSPSGCPTCAVCDPLTTTKAPVVCPVFRCAEPANCPSQRYITPKDANGCDLCPVCEPIPDGAVWNDCGSACPATCENYGKPRNVMCVQMCVGQYQCVTAGMIFHDGKCITGDQCPSATTVAPVAVTTPAPGDCSGPCMLPPCAAPLNGCAMVPGKDACGCATCGTMQCATPVPACPDVCPQPKCAAPKPMCQVTLVKDECGCTSCGEQICAVCDPPFCAPPPPNCDYRGAIMDAANCNFSCGTLVCSGDDTPATPQPASTTTESYGTRVVLVGGFSPIKDLADAALLSATNCAVGLLDAASNSLYTHSVVQIVKASRQVVAGLNYVVTVDLATTTCRYGVVATGNCQIVEGTTTRWEMHFYVGFSGMCANMASGPSFTQLQLGSTTDVPVETTVDNGNGGGIAGGYHAITDLADASVVAAASCAVGLIDAASRTQYRHALVQVVSGKEQVVAGLNYQLVLDIAPTACRVTAAASADCPATAGAAVTRWTIQFFVGFDGVCENPAGGPVISLGDNNNGGSVDPTSSVDQGAASSSSNSAASIGIPVGVVAGCLLVVLVVLAVMRTRNASNARVTVAVAGSPSPSEFDVLANPTYESNPFLQSTA